jgi:hypothetical protein
MVADDGLARGHSFCFAPEDMMTSDAVATLKRTVRGRLIGAADTDYDYDDARALYNGMIDKRPALIARCVDVVEAVNVARTEGAAAGDSWRRPQRSRSRQL